MTRKRKFKIIPIIISAFLLIVLISAGSFGIALYKTHVKPAQKTNCLQYWKEDNLVLLKGGATVEKCLLPYREAIKFAGKEENLTFWCLDSSVKNSFLHKFYVAYTATIQCRDGCKNILTSLKTTRLNQLSDGVEVYKVKSAEEPPDAVALLICDFEEQIARYVVLYGKDVRKSSDYISLLLWNTDIA